MKRKIAVLLVAIASMASVALVLRDQFSVEQMAERELQLRQIIQLRPFTSLFAGLGIYYALSLIPGTSGKAIVAGWLFGVWRGVFIVDAGLTAAALTTFALSRYVFRDLVESRMSRFLSRLNNAIEREAAFYLLSLRMLHVPFTLVNYGSGASRVSTWTFAWTTLVGLLPGVALFVFLGTQMPTLSELVEHGPQRLLDPWLAVALIGMGLLPWGMRTIIRRVRGTESTAGLLGKTDGEDDE